LLETAFVMFVIVDSVGSARSFDRLAGNARPVIGSALSTWIIAVGTFLAIESALQRSGCWPFGDRRRWRARLSTAIDHIFTSIAEPDGLIEERDLWAVTTNTNIVRAGVVDGTALILGIRIIAIRLFTAVDWQFCRSRGLCRCSGLSRRWVTSSAVENVGPIDTSIFCDVVKKTRWARHSHRCTAGAFEVIFGAFLGRWQVRTVLFLFAVEFA